MSAARWGIAGCGWLARDHIAPALGDRLLAAYDPAGGADVRGVAVTDDLDAFLATPGLELVYVAAPNDAHRPLTEAAAAAGLHVLCEKPMALSLADARAMVDACDRAGVQYATAHNQRFHPAHVALRGADLGAVSQARIHYACTAPPWWGEGDWHWDAARAGGGALWDLAPHGLDLLTTLLGAPAEDVVVLRQGARGDVETGAVLAGRWGGALGVLQVSYACPETYPRRRLELVGDRAMAIAEDTMGQVPGGRVTLVDAADGRTHALAFDAEGDPFARMVAAFAARVDGDADAWPHPPEQDLGAVAVLDALGSPA